MEKLKKILGSAKEAADEDRFYKLAPHRTNDNQNSEESWVWKLEEYSWERSGEPYPRFVGSRIL